MHRRTFLTSLAILPAMGLPALASGTEYTPGLIETALAEGETVFVDYAADWCSTCARQERIINALRQENPAYDANILFVRVDWDDFGSAPVSTTRNIPRRSTLIVLKGDKELGRIVAGTQKNDIQSLMDTALQAATTS